MVDAPDLQNKNSISIIVNRKSKGSDITKVTRDKTDRGDSKISNKITKSFLENEKGYLRNPLDYKKIVEETNSELNDSLIKESDFSKEIILNEPIRINIEIPDGEDKMMLKYINLRITNKVTIIELLRQSLDLFNDLFSSTNIPFVLNSDLKNYSIKPSKKSGRPDNDLPKINLSYKVFDTNMKAFSIIYDEKDLQPIKKFKNFFKCDKCLVW